MTTFGLPAPRLRTSTAALLYFADDHTFALMYWVVNQVPREYTSISHGDGVALYRGQWMVDRKGVAMWYEFVPVRHKQWTGFPGAACQSNTQSFIEITTSLV